MKSGRMSGVAQVKIGAAVLIRAARKRRSAKDGRGLNADQAWIGGQILHPQRRDKTEDAFNSTPARFSGTVGSPRSSCCSLSACRACFNNQATVANLKRSQHVCHDDDHAKCGRQRPPAPTTMQSVTPPKMASAERWRRTLGALEAA